MQSSRTLMIIILAPAAVIYLFWCRAAGQKKTNIQQKIEQLASLKDQALISEEEYEQKKKQLLERVWKVEKPRLMV